MKKIISLFQRNYDGDCLVRDEVMPGAEWVIAGEGTATQKLDGTCCLYEDGKLWKRRTLRLRKGKNVPDGFRPATEVDPNTGIQQGWVPVEPTDKYHMEALERQDLLYEGTYELVGPKVQGNPEGYGMHVLCRHGATFLHDAPRTYDGLKAYFEGENIEGVVWHHRDGRMVKIKAKDFGLSRERGEEENG